jgi:hypothetical protein
LLEDDGIVVQARAAKQACFGKTCAFRFTKNLQRRAIGVLGLKLS